LKSEGATKAFGNRTYVWKGVPDRFQQGWSFTQTDGGQRGRIFIRAKRDCTVYAATVAGTPGLPCASESSPHLVGGL